jgi:orotidine-5'-phosphate decarboxylase
MKVKAGENPLPDSLLTGEEKEVASPLKGNEKLAPAKEEGAELEPRVIVALDFPDAQSALALAGRLQPSLCRLKVGSELFTAAGPRLLEGLAGRGFGVFLDLKFHDIPNTVAQACKAAAKLGVWMLNVHALGGRAMMNAAREAIEPMRPRPRLIAVTVLTSHMHDDLAAIGVEGTPQSAALRLAQLAHASGLDGVVCSALEAPALRADRGADFLLVTPGIRSAHDAGDDQKRIATPRAAIQNGADYLVVGRPIAQAPDPAAALAAIDAQVRTALGSASSGGGRG